MTVVRRCVCSRNLIQNEEAITRVGLQRQAEGRGGRSKFMIN